MIRSDSINSLSSVASAASSATSSSTSSRSSFLDEVQDQDQELAEDLSDQTKIMDDDLVQEEEEEERHRQVQRRESRIQLVNEPKKLNGYVGFDTLPQQVFRRALRKGFEFNLMVVGESGLGKSTLINSMFMADVYDKEDFGDNDNNLSKTSGIETKKILLKEKGVDLTLTLVDTPGFGDAVNNEDSWEPIIQYVDDQFNAYLEDETRVDRQCPIPDSRVHACLYFIAPTGHTLKPLDIEFMKRIHNKVNIIPVIGKADTLTPDEMTAFKTRINDRLVTNKIRTYDFFENNNNINDDGNGNRKSPFAVVGSNCTLEAEDGSRLRGRKYPWGVVNIENIEHCDFLSLRNLLIRSHLQDLKSKTSQELYEIYRSQTLSVMSCNESNTSPLKLIDDERSQHEERLGQMQIEMEHVFDRKVKEKTKRLRDLEADLSSKLKEAEAKLEADKRDLEARMEMFDKERLAWSRTYGISMEELQHFDETNRKKGRSVTLNGKHFRLGR